MKILLYFHGGSKNRGCEAIVRSAIPIIKKSLPHATLDLASWDPASDTDFTGISKIYDVQPQPIAKFSLDWFISLYHVKVHHSEAFAHKTMHKRLLDLIPHYDLLLSVGGDNYCYGEQPWLYVVDEYIKKAGKKLVLWGASIGEEDLSPAKIADLKQFDLLLVRETLTEAVLNQHGIANVKLCADGAFTMVKEELPLPEGWQENNTIGFNYSPLVWKRNQASKEAAQHLIQHILDTTTLTVALTPHVMIPGNNDYEMLVAFYERFQDHPRVILLPDTLNAIQYKGYIARMRFFIGARTHATIAAYSNYVPTMVLGYSIKSKGIAKDIFGFERLVLGINEIADTEKLIQKFEELKRDETELREILTKEIPRIQSMSYKAGEYLATLA
ncbi:polysaccharide pyruvyl transferase family protein [Flavobacterium piscinae]|uniref:Polysaccharide pyruvyl transferase family protein n=1 Tax=Flavobacterium piscinae TaxID=2506424 RepID=A0A4Q1KFY1_9FLAO|nr:polysaccharide pyruvyl transferase family protein [Flavobacterium piscinae]RXR27737.1 polysaccharide pyruvyl transferase family protein [Flavobacterium piscinae]